MINDDVCMNGLFLFLKQLIPTNILQLLSHLYQLGMEIVDLALDC